MQFAFPEALWLVWLLPVLGLVMLLARRRADARVERFAGTKLSGAMVRSVSRPRRAWRAVLRLAALTLLLIAAARPQWGASEVDVEQKGIDIVVALDISRSMLADDVKPSRLTRAKVEIQALVESLRGDRIGLVFFAGAAFPQCPLTVDYPAARLFLSQADPSMISAQGTDLASALETSLELLGDGDSNHKVILLVTDGEDFSERLDEVREQLQRQGVLLFAVGMGTPEGAPIPVVDEAGTRQGFFRDESGQVVVSRLEEAPLLELVRAANGVYIRTGAAGIDLNRLRSELSSLEGRTFAARRVTSYQERYAWPVGAGLLLLLIEGFLHDRRRKS